MNPQNITLSAIISEPTEYIQAVQGENNARVFSFTVLDAAGQAIDMEGCTAAFYAVSYTHLDVYKRQLQEGIRLLRNRLKRDFLCHRSVPVGYSVQRDFHS